MGEIGRQSEEENAGMHEWKESWKLENRSGFLNFPSFHIA